MDLIIGTTAPTIQMRSSPARARSPHTPTPLVPLSRNTLRFRSSQQLYRGAHSRNRPSRAPLALLHLLFRPEAAHRPLSELPAIGRSRVCRLKVYRHRQARPRQKTRRPTMQTGWLLWASLQPRTGVDDQLKLPSKPDCVVYVIDYRLKHGQLRPMVHQRPCFARRRLWLMY